MTKLTTELLLKHGLPKSKSLKELKKLNLSKMHLETKDIDPKLFSQMVNLEELDISGNLISEIPSNLQLHNLRVLNFNDNQVEEITVLKQFPNLEEVMYEENLYLTVSDNHKIFCLLPKLRRLNNKDITSLANHFRFVNHRELSSRVESYWEKNYKEKLPKDSPEEKIKAIGKDFMKTVVDHVRYGPNSLKDFTKWKVKMIAQELISFMLARKEKKSEHQLQHSTEESSDVKNLESSKNKRNLSSDCPEVSPTKRQRITSESLSVSLLPCRSTKLQQTPFHTTQIKLKEGSTRQEQPGKKGLMNYLSDKSSPLKKQPKVDSALSTGKRNLQFQQKLKKGLHMEPLHFLQCHSKSNSSDDFSTQLWACAFEPALDNSLSKVASCGGDSVCVTDCDTGKVLKKYKVTGEEFFTLAWSTLTMINKEGQKRKINILAAAGKLGIIKLIHPKINLAYGEIKAHKKAISVICFSPHQETFLFSGSYDKRIILWDIGVPDCEYNFRASQLLILDASSTPLRICPVPACPDQYLLAACEDGCFVWDIKLNKTQGKRSWEVEFNFPIYNNETKKSDFHIIDGLAFLNQDLIVSKSAMQGSIYVWSWERSFRTKKSKGPKKLDAVILAELKWSETDLPYLTLSASSEGFCVFCGDEAGKVWIYDLHTYEAELIKGIFSNTLKEPSKILHWPSLTSSKDVVSGPLINNVAVDSALQYLVALTDKNLIAIWKIL
ncbi:leucine-rich repeat and WD repeat-containing protein 1 [Spea bombifrons]|uniref:leucine-rich repeat and WD repeat-containing protein 1 n=1 Tax=Spea bombifrons TaxID=233779 RepID=UPI00234BB7C6|nr:leucine-rich repeat and WD repeat-containing protein 1 [Spea bombifrons]